MTEAQLQKLVLDWLFVNQIFHYRNNSGAVRAYHRGRERFFRFGAKGSPDIVAVLDGKYIGIEIKGPKGKVSEHQESFGMALQRAGGRYLVVYKLEDLTQALRCGHER